MDHPVFRGFMMMNMMMDVRGLGVHIVWQYTNLNAIWQA